MRNARHIPARTARAIGAGLTMAGALLARGASAVDTGLSKTAGTAGLTSGNLPQIIGRFIGALLGLVGSIFVVLIIWAGVNWMTAQGNDEKIKKAKATITGAVIGLVIIFASYAIVNTVVSALTSSIAG
jgi:hypothetical protein